MTFPTKRRRRDGKPNRADLRDSRSQAWWAQRRSEATSAEELAAVEWRRVRAVLARVADPVTRDRRWAAVTRFLRAEGDAE
jgi:hypothetical protein